MHRILLLAGISLTCAACSSQPVAQVQPIDGVISGQCHTDKARGAVGLAASPGTIERARVDSDSLRVDVVGGGTVQHTASQPAPATSGGDQLVIEVGRTNNITAMRCG